ncbi:transporter substrate-binding domain-containing protein [Myxosarcina sp. GI1]|uniref:transporter substrate-binding domain-containing protein n=1 Tax=Myxosarcina sp. GI1 TaxID=1541065 RepID=UPI0005688B65|nr:transporter substrate-binding domain-containing protein [Myxosarcina sp. GI1]
MKQSFFNLAMAIGTITALSLPSFSVAAEWTEIKDRGQIIVGVKDNLRPLGFTDAKGNLAGLEIDIARKLAAELLGDSEAIEFVPVSNKERLQVVLDDKVDLAIARISVTTSRSRIVEFSPYYYLDGTGLVTKDANIKNIDSLSRATIAVLENSATIAVIRNRLPNATLIGVDSYAGALKLLETQQADAFAGDRSVLTGWIQEYPEYKLLPERLSGAPLSIVMPRGLQYQELRDKVNDAIARWQESGWLQERIEYWGL